jgi:hypothetical protein
MSGMEAQLATPAIGPDLSSDIAVLQRKHADDHVRTTLAGKHRSSGYTESAARDRADDVFRQRCDRRRRVTNTIRIQIVGMHQDHLG